LSSDGNNLAGFVSAELLITLSNCSKKSHISGSLSGGNLSLEFPLIVF
jgi:hypothetical protein